MANRPRWLSFAALTVISAVVVTACTGPAAPTSTVAPTGTVAPTATQGATATPGTSVTPGTTPTTGPTEAPTPAPTGTAYPSPLAQPADPAAITDAFPTTASRSIAQQGLERPAVRRQPQVADGPEDQTVVFTFCNPDVAFLSKIAFSVFAINDSDWLIAHARGRRCGSQTMNGTGPYKLDQWQQRH